MGHYALASAGLWPWIAVATWSVVILWVGFFAVVRRRRNVALNGGSILVLGVGAFTTYRHYGWIGVALLPPGFVLMGLLVVLYFKARGRPLK